MTRGQLCGTCGCGPTPHHGDEDGCWGKNCITRPVDERCKKWMGVPTAKAGKTEVITGPAAPRPSDDLWRANRPKQGSLSERAYAEVQRSPDGLTCDEIEAILNESHQSTSAAVNWLMNHRWLLDSGRRRKTRYGRDATVWLDADRDQSPLPGLPG